MQAAYTSQVIIITRKHGKLSVSVTVRWVAYRHIYIQRTILLTFGMLYLPQRERQKHALLLSSISIDSTLCLVPVHCAGLLGQIHVNVYLVVVIENRRHTLGLGLSDMNVM